MTFLIRTRLPSSGPDRDYMLTGEREGGKLLVSWEITFNFIQTVINIRKTISLVDQKEQEPERWRDSRQDD